MGQRVNRESNKMKWHTDKISTPALDCIDEKQSGDFNYFENSTVKLHIINLHDYSIFMTWDVKLLCAVQICN